MLFAVAIAAAGCSSGLIKANGRVLKDGAPLSVADRERLQVIFYPEPDTGEVYPANAKHSEGTFSVPGKTGKGIPAGKYRISVEILGPLDIDQLKGRFDAKKTPFVHEIASSEEIVLDIGKSSG